MKQIIEYYNGNDEWGRLDREPLEFIINMHHIKAHLPGGARILDNGAGPGKYAFFLTNLGHKVTLSDITPKLVETAIVKAKENPQLPELEGFHVLDATDLSVFADDYFDAVLMLGPFYHLQDEESRRKALNELRRVTRPGGKVFVAFMTRTRFLATSLQYPQRWKPNHTAEGIKEFLDTGLFNHDEEGRFTGAYYFNIDDIKPFMESSGFKTINLIGSRSIAGTMTEEQWSYWRSRGDDEYKTIMELVISESENPYVLGVSSHILYIGEKDI